MALYRKFQQAKTARVCTLALLLDAVRLTLRYFLHLFLVSNDFTLRAWSLELQSIDLID